MFRTKYLLMDQASSTEGVSGYGTGQASTTDTTTTQAAGNTSAAVTDTTNTQGTPNQAAATGDQSQQAAATEQKVNVIGYSTEAVVPGETTKPAEGTETKPAEATTESKNDTIVEEFKVDTRGLTDEQTKDLIDFAKENKFTPEQAQVLLDKRKSELDKYTSAQAEADKTVADTYKKWEGDLRADWGSDYAPNIQIVNNTLTNHFPETAKLLAATGKRMNPVQVKEFLALGKKLGDEGTFEAGSSNTNKKERHPSDYYSN